MSPAGVEKYLADLASGLRRVATGENAAALREHLSEAYDIAVEGPPPRALGAAASGPPVALARAAAMSSG